MVAAKLLELDQHSIFFIPLTVLSFSSRSPHIFNPANIDAVFVVQVIPLNFNKVLPQSPHDTISVLKCSSLD